MSPATRVVSLLGGVFLCLVCGAGCGGSPAPASTEGGTKLQPGSGVVQAGAKNALPPAAIGSGARVKNADGVDDEDEDDPELADEAEVKVAPPKEGTPEWLVHEATRIRLLPPPKTEDVEKLKADRKQRNEKIITLAQQAILLTHKDKKQERLLNVAVHQLMEARLQLALTGNRAEVDSMYEDAAALQARDPESQAAAEGAYTLVNFAYSRAKSSSNADPRWLQEFARQATHYATDFPREETRSLPLLFTAARSCELHGLLEESTACYALIRKKFPKSPYAERVVGILRRLKLPGQAAQLSGPTIAGGNVAIDDLEGRVVLVVFWSTEAKPFETQLPTLLQIHRKYAKQGLAVIGVNLDKEPTPVSQFVVANKVPWPQIFYPEPEKRGWNNPIATFYGVLEIPALWLIDPQGKVVSTNLAAADAEGEIRKLLQSDTAAVDPRSGQQTR